MAAQTPELIAIMQQVEAELVSMLASGETGQVAIHVGRGDLAVEVTSRRKHAPVVIAQERRLAVIRKTR